VTGLWFSPGTLVSFTNKTDRHDITEILLKVALNTIKLNPNNKNKIAARHLGITVHLIYYKGITVHLIYYKYNIK